MILPWAHRLTQPGRTVCVVFRASPLIWPTPYLARTTRPGPSTRCTPGGFPRGAMSVGMGERGARSTSCASVRGDMRSSWLTWSFWHAFV